MARVGEGATTWVSAGLGTSPEVPLTVTFEAGCGRVLFTSYHTHRGNDGEEDRGLNAQEMILGYLAFEMGTCIQEPTLF